MFLKLTDLFLLDKHTVYCRGGKDHPIPLLSSYVGSLARSRNQIDTTQINKERHTHFINFTHTWESSQESEVQRSDQSNMLLYILDKNKQKKHHDKFLKK